MSAGGVNSNRVPRGKYTLTQFVLTCILSDMPSLSDSSSARFLVPRTFLRVVWASSRVDECALDTLATAEMGQCMRKYTTPSTATVTESLVRICKVKMLQLWCCHYSDHNMTDCFLLTSHKWENAQKKPNTNNVPLAEGCQRTQFSDPPSQSYQCKAEQRKVLERCKDPAFIFCIQSTGVSAI